MTLVLSVVLYVGDVGFYSDDWSFLGILHTSSDQSLLGLCRALFSGNLRMRPVQVVYLASLYKVFGLHPLGYHLTNLVVTAALAILFYLTLRELKQSRIIALSLPTVFILLPHYSTDRFWIAAFQTNLSVALYLFSLFSDLRAMRAQTNRVWVWKLLAILSLIGSTMAYEVTLPLFLLNIALLWRGSHKESSLQSSTRKAEALRLWGGNLLALLLVVVFKAVTTDRAGIQTDSITHLSYILKEAFRINYVAYGVALPHVTWKVLRSYQNRNSLLLGVLLGTLIFVYLYQAIRTARGLWPTRGYWVKMIALSLVVFVLGYAVFFTTSQIQFHKTGIANRVAIAGALGVAMSMVGFSGLFSTLFSRPRLRSLFFSLCVAILGTSCFWIINSIALFWGAADRDEQTVLTDIYRHVPALPPGSTLLLDGVCPYDGPVPVFESSWDLAGALKIHYNESTIRADVTKPRLEVREDGIHIPIYGFQEFYPYGETLLIYHYGKKTVYPITSFEEARHYFQVISPTRNSECPPGEEGYGVAIF
jgi:hypothetical protein